MAYPYKLNYSYPSQAPARSRFMILLMWSFAISALFIVQLAFGADIRILLLAAATALIGFLILNAGGFYHMSSLVGFAFLFNTLFFGILLKTVIGQPIDSNLYSPYTSFLIVFLVALQIFFAQKFVQVVPVGKPLFRPLNDLKFLKYIAITCYVLGLVFWLLSQRYHVDPRLQNVGQEKGFGGFTTIYPIFYMSVVAATAFTLRVSNNKKSVNVWLLLILLTSIIMALVESRKMLLGLTFGNYFITSFVYRRRISVKQIIFGILLVLFIFFIFAPVVHVYRTDLWFLPFEQRFDYLVTNITKLVQSNYLFDYFRRVIYREYSLNNYQYFGQNLMFIDRFATIQHSDLIIDTFENRDAMGPEIMTRGFDLILPSFLNPNKRSLSLGDEITWEVGIRKYGVIGFPTVPLIGSSFAALKWVGVLFMPLVIFILLFLLLKKIGPDIRQKIFAIYFLVPV